MMFAQVFPAVTCALQECQVADRTDFKQLVKDELAEVSPNLSAYTTDARQLRALYELRAQYLDWELGTGYLGCFARNPGTRYTFTRRLEVVLHMLRTRLQALPSGTPPLRILEIGCGAGVLCLELAPQADTVMGIDVSQVALHFANRVKTHARVTNVAFFQGDAEHLPFANACFDVVICSEVLEHVLQPDQALREIKRVLTPEGTVFLSTPCALSLSDLTMNIARRFLPRLESEQNVQFDKKTYLAVQRNATETQALSTAWFVRVHERFQYTLLSALFRRSGFDVRQAVGTIVAFPPHYQVFYRLCPGWLLAGIRLTEHLLNRIGLFQRCGAVTTCFWLQCHENT